MIRIAFGPFANLRIGRSFQTNNKKSIAFRAVHIQEENKTGQLRRAAQALRSEILGVKEISENPLTKRVTAVFDKNKNGTVRRPSSDHLPGLMFSKRFCSVQSDTCEYLRSCIRRRLFSDILLKNAGSSREFRADGFKPTASSRRLEQAFPEPCFVDLQYTGLFYRVPHRACALSKHSGQGREASVLSSLSFF